MNATAEVYICGSSGLDVDTAVYRTKYIHRYVHADMRPGKDFHTCSDVVCLHMGIITLV